jgi:hypothetical protein
MLCNKKIRRDTDLREVSGTKEVALWSVKLIQGLRVKEKTGKTEHKNHQKKYLRK